MVIDYIEILSTPSHVCVFVTPSVSRMKKKGKTVNCNCNGQSKVGWSGVMGGDFWPKSTYPVLLPLLLASVRRFNHPSIAKDVGKIGPEGVDRLQQ